MARTKYFPKPIGRVLCLFIVALLMGATSCSWFGKKESEIKGPLLAMMVASSIDDKGELVNPRFTFPPDEKQITAVVQLGKTTASTLTVTWYLESDEGGDKKLFEHQIQVKNYDRAFSTGKNPGPALLVGSYKVVAALGGETQEVEFDIAPPKSASSTTSSRWDDDLFENQVQLERNRYALSARPDSVDAVAASRYDLESTGGLMRRVSWNESFQSGPSQPTGSSTEPGQPPAAGSSGVTSNSSGYLGSVGGSKVLKVMGADGNTDLHANVVQVFSAGVWSNTDSNFVVSVYETTTNRKLGEYYLAAMVPNAGTFRLDPCENIGSDLPATKVPVKAVIRTSNGVELGSVDNVITLGADTLAPRVHVTSTPARGTKVKPGDKINLKVEATELRTGGPWQTGVKMIQVVALPSGGMVKEAWVNSANPLSQKCTQKTWKQDYDATYTVPKDPPPIIQMCAIVEDYVGNESAKCGDFPTAGDWYGSLDWSVHQTVSSGTQDWKGHADLLLTEDGTGGLTGTLSGTETQKLNIADCQGDTDWTVTARLTGTITTSAKKMTINLMDHQSTRPEEASCGRAKTGGDIFSYRKLDEVFRSLTPSADGKSYQHHDDFTVSGGTGQITLIVRQIGQ